MIQVRILRDLVLFLADYPPDVQLIYFAPLVEVIRELVRLGVLSSWLFLDVSYPDRGQG